MNKKTNLANKSLNSKEILIASYLVSGMSVKEIAKELKLSTRTVEYYQKRIKKKLISKNAFQTGYKIGILLKDHNFPIFTLNNDKGGKVKC